MNKCVHNQVFVIENHQMTVYSLDDKRQWMVGRPSEGNRPDIPLSSLTVSRKHGMFYNEEGVWFYQNLSRTNGSYYLRGNYKKEKKKIEKTLMLEDGDVLYPGSGNEEPDGVNAWILFVGYDYGEKLQVVDTVGCDRLVFNDGEKQVELECPEPGTVVRFKGGMAIYMWETTYLIGSVELKV